MEVFAVFAMLSRQERRLNSPRCHEVFGFLGERHTSLSLLSDDIFVENSR